MDYGQQPSSSNAYYAQASLLDHNYDQDSFMVELKRMVTAPPMSSDSDDDDGNSNSQSDNEEANRQRKCSSARNIWDELS